MPEKVEEMVDAILEDNPDMDESTAYAIAHDQYNGEGSQKSAKQAILDSFRAASANDRVELAKAAAGGTVERVEFSATAEGSVGTLWKSDDEDDFVIWGPASVEVVDKENDRISASALEDALPQLMKRQSLSYEHSDQIVGEILDKFETEEPVTVEIGDETLKRQEFPTDVLDDELENPALFVAGNVYGDTKKAQEVRDEIEAGNINSYSISGEAIVTSMAVENGQPVTDISKLDLSAVTLCRDGMNPQAKFGTVKKHDESHETTATTTQLDSLLKRKTMSDDTLTKEGMESILDKHLPDGELATKGDVESIARETAEEVVKENATDTGSPSEGSTEEPEGEDPDMEEDPEYEGDSPDETASDPDKVEEKAHDDHPEGCRCDSCQMDKSAALRALKSSLSPEQWKQVRKMVDQETLEDPDNDGEEEMEVVPPEEDDMPEEEDVPDAPGEDEEDEMPGAEKAKALGLNPQNLTREQRENLAKADLSEVDGVDAPAGAQEPNYDMEKNSPESDTTMAGSNFFDENGGVQL